MSDYIVSARKYRPESFETLVGQDVIAQTLKNSILRGKLAHAYLFCGPRGVGKTSMARLFAKAINCSNPSADMDPCGECESCISFREGRSYCIHELDAASNNGVDDIKALMDMVQIPPQVGKYSVYIIDEVHMLSQAAFNSFLKTLEEPPAHAIFILATTEKHKIIPTILSRCQTYDFNRISIMDMVKNLKSIAGKEGIKVDDESLHVIAKKADGAMRDALTIFDQTVAFCGTDIRYEEVVRNLNVLDYEYCFNLVDAFLIKDYAAALKIFDEILTKGFNALHFIASLSSHLRDLIVCRTASLDSLLDLTEALKQRYKEQTERCSLQFLYEALNVTSHCEAGYKASSNPRLHIEFALMKLAFLAGLPAAAAQVQPQVAQPLAAPAQPQVEQPQLQPQSQDPKEEPVRKPRTKAASALSMSALMEEEKIEAEDKEDKQVDTKSITDFILTQKWKELSDSTSSRPRLQNALQNASLSFYEEDGKKVVSFEVTNEAQKNWIEQNLLRNLENTYCKLVGASNIILKVTAKEVIQQEVIYTAEDKAKDLMEHNSEVKNLIIDLGLDTK